MARNESSEQREGGKQVQSAINKPRSEQEQQSSVDTAEAPIFMQQSMPDNES